MERSINDWEANYKSMDAAKLRYEVWRLDSMQRFMPLEEKNARLAYLAREIALKTR